MNYEPLYIGLYYIGYQGKHENELHVRVVNV